MQHSWNSLPMKEPGAKLGAAPGVQARQTHELRKAVHGMDSWQVPLPPAKEGIDWLTTWVRSSWWKSVPVQEPGAKVGAAPGVQALQTRVTQNALRAVHGMDSLQVPLPPAKASGIGSLTMWVSSLVHGQAPAVPKPKARRS